ncbi:MAG: tetratricopeptide repeat protein, partial [Brevinematia bacterium]
KKGLAITLISIVILILIMGVIIVYLRISEENAYKTIKNRFDYGLYQDVVRDGTKFLADYSHSKHYYEVEYFVTYSSYITGNSDIAKRRLLSLIRKFFVEGKNDDILTKSIELLGDILRQKNEAMDPEIEEYLKQALVKVQDDNIRRNILTQLGYIYFYRKDYENALIYFEKANTELAELGKARVFIDKGDYESAFYIYDNFLKYRSGSKYYKSVYDAYSKQLYTYAFRLLRDKDYSQAAKYFVKTVNTFPNTIYEDAALYWLGEVYAIYKKYDKALEFFDKAMSNEPKNKDEDALFKKGVVLYQAGKMIDSLANFKKFLLDYPNSRLSQEAKKWIEILTKEIQYSYQEDEVE